MNAVFYIAATIGLASTAAVVLTSSPVRALRWLALSLLATAVLAYTLAAPLVASVAASLHVGALVLARGLPDAPALVARERRWRAPRAWVVPGVLAAIVLLELAYVLVVHVGAGSLDGAVSSAALGAALAEPYAVAAVLALLLVVTALIAGLHLIRRSPGRGARDG